MCEDSVEKLSMDSVRKPLDVLLPKLIALFTCPDEMVSENENWGEKYKMVTNISMNDLQYLLICNDLSHQKIQIKEKSYLF